MPIIPLKKPFDTVLKVLCGVGALNWLTSELLAFNVLTYIPGPAIVKTIAVVAIGASGAYILGAVWKKKI